MSVSDMLVMQLLNLLYIYALRFEFVSCYHIDLTNLTFIQTIIRIFGKHAEKRADHA